MAAGSVGNLYKKGWIAMGLIFEQFNEQLVMP